MAAVTNVCFGSEADLTPAKGMSGLLPKADGLGKSLVQSGVSKKEAVPSSTCLAVRLCHGKACLGVRRFIHVDTAINFASERRACEENRAHGGKLPSVA